MSSKLVGGRFFQSGQRKQPSMITAVAGETRFANRLICFSTDAGDENRLSARSSITRRGSLGRKFQYGSEQSMPWIANLKLGCMNANRNASNARRMIVTREIGRAHV